MAAPGKFDADLAGGPLLLASPRQDQVRDLGSELGRVDVGGGASTTNQTPGVRLRRAYLEMSASATT